MGSGVRGRSNMGVIFSIEEILDIAVQIEKNGCAFYKKAAEKTVNPEAKKLFQELADWEVQHIDIFSRLKEELVTASTQLVFDPDNEGTLYLNAFAGGHVFDLQRDPASEISDNTDVEDVLKMAIGLEKDAIVFYLGLKDLVPENLGKDKVDSLVREEMTHVRILGDHLRDMKK